MPTPLHERTPERRTPESRNPETADALEALIGTDGDSRRAFLTILLASLRRLEGGMADVSRKLDAIEDGHAAETLQSAARMAAMETRIDTLEAHRLARGEGNWRVIQQMASWAAIGIALLALILKH